MKRKLDHVTNSSSVSFCGFGIEVECCLEVFPEAVKRGAYNEYLEWKKKYRTEEGPLSYEEFLEDNDDWYEWIESFITKNNLSIQSWWDADATFIGKTLHSMPKDRPIDEIIKDTQLTLDNLGFNKKIGPIEEAWRDG